ncbi:aminoglycoside phosphotransferase family protein [Bacillus sp. CGMCC 1.16607]|uniref:aminoglycoside phosphotransferase family protein n=1 Tax=Bacillus sp. CGMCC 1.16607 TaxID=3351842 RepID=UPI003629D43E
MNSQLQSKVEKIIGEIRQLIKPDEQGCTSEVRQIITDNGTYILKSSYKNKYREWLKAEAIILEKLNNQSQIPVPKYYGFIEENESSHLIMSFVHGMTLTIALKQAKNIEEKKLLIKSFGHFLHKLHETPIIETLNLTNNWLDDQLIKAERYAKSGQADGSPKLLEKLKSTKPLPVQQTIIHGDCTTDNVLVVDGEVQFLIDVAGMTVGDPRYDESLAIGRLIHRDEYIAAFYEGYTRYKVSKEEYQYFDQGLYEFF